MRAGPRLRPVLPTLRPGTLSLARRPTDSLPFPLGGDRRVQLWYLGRNAIYAALGELGLAPGETVLVPAYTNGVEVAAIRARGLAVRTVRIRDDFSLDLDDLHEKLRLTRARLVLAIHYLGFAQPIDEIAGITRAHGARLFEDCALSFLARLPDGRPLGSVGDLAVFSLYKTLPVPDGAALVLNDPAIPFPRHPVEPALSSSASGLGRLVLDGARSGGPAAQAFAFALDGARRAASQLFAHAKVERTAAGSMKFETARLPWGASRFTRAILPRLDYAGIVEARRRNFAHLRHRLAGVPTFFRTLPRGACPLFYPLVVDRKGPFIRALARLGIRTVDFWSTWDEATPPDEHPGVAWLRAHVVELPCLQDLDLGAIDFIADAVLDRVSLRSGFSPAPDQLREAEDLGIELHAGGD